MMEIIFSKAKSDFYKSGEQKRIEEAAKKLDFNIVDFEPLINGTLFERVNHTISIGKGDIVFVQFPTGFGTEFEAKLINIIKEYEAIMIAIACDETIDTSDSWLGEAECVIATTINIKEALIRAGVSKEKIISRIIDDTYETYLVQKILLDAIEPIISSDKLKRELASYEKLGEVVHCAFALYDKDGSYSVYVGTVMLSLLEHTKSKVHFHIIHDDSLSNDNKIRLRSIAEKYDSICEFHRIDVEGLSIDNDWLKRYSIGSMFRCYLPDVLYYLSKVIYLDADLMILRDIKALWDIDISDYSLAGVHDIGFERGIMLPSVITRGMVKMEDYINSGLLIMNLDRIRMGGSLLQKSIDFIESTPDTFLPDQDALNYLYSGEILLLDSCWNTYTRYARQEARTVDNVVYHFMGERDINYSDPTEYDKLYLDYMQRTPWGYSSVEWRLYAGMWSAFDKVNMLQKVLTRIAASDKKRIYIGKNTLSMNSIEKMLPPRFNDYYVGEDMINQNGFRKGIPVKNITELAFEKKGEFIAFVLPEAENGSAIGTLDEMGYINGEDYFVIPRILIAKQGGYTR